MTINLSDFLTDMRDSNRKVLVSEKQLRDYAIQCQRWEHAYKKVNTQMETLLNRIEYLENKLNNYKMKEPVTINLTA